MKNELIKPETAKLLKLIGVPQESTVNVVGGKTNILSSDDRRNQEIPFPDAGSATIHTQTSVVRWLRENREITVQAVSADGSDSWLTFVKAGFTMDISPLIDEFESYEEALEAGIVTAAKFLLP